VEFPIVITVKNVGGGTVCRGGSTDCKKQNPAGAGENDNWNKVDIKIILPNGQSFAQGSCDATGLQLITFVGNDPQTFSCKIVADMANQIGIVQKQIEVTSSYGYFIDKTTEISVFPSAEPITSPTPAGNK
jgi:hypothetical protein